MVEVMYMVEIRSLSFSTKVYGGNIFLYLEVFLFLPKYMVEIFLETRRFIDITHGIHQNDVISKKKKILLRNSGER